MSSHSDISDIKASMEKPLAELAAAHARLVAALGLPKGTKIDIRLPGKPTEIK